MQKGYFPGFFKLRVANHCGMLWGAAHCPEARVLTHSKPQIRCMTLGCSSLSPVPHLGKEGVTEAEVPRIQGPRFPNGQVPGGVLHATPAFTPKPSNPTSPSQQPGGREPRGPFKGSSPASAARWGLLLAAPGRGGALCGSEGLGVGPEAARPPPPLFALRREVAARVGGVCARVPRCRELRVSPARCQPAQRRRAMAGGDARDQPRGAGRG